jgi:hypothetical protein
MRADRKIAVWFSPAVAAAAFFVAAEASRRQWEAAWLAIFCAGAVATLVAAWAGYVVSRRGHSRREALLLAITPAMLVSGSFGCFLIAGNVVERVGVAVVAVALLAPYLTYLRGVSRADSRFTGEKFSHLSFAVHVAAMFFVTAFSAEIPGYLRVPLPAAVISVGAAALAASAETLRRAGHVGRDAAALAASAALLMMQLFLAMSFLPTAGIVNAAVLTVLYATGLRAAAAILSGAPVKPSVMRRDFAFSFILVAVVLSTARWA